MIPLTELQKSYALIHNDATLMLKIWESLRAQGVDVAMAQYAGPLLQSILGSGAGLCIILGDTKDPKGALDMIKTQKPLAQVLNIGDSSLEDVTAQLPASQHSVEEIVAAVLKF
jgi:hypothetical protein